MDGRPSTRHLHGRTARAARCATVKVTPARKAVSNLGVISTTPRTTTTTVSGEVVSRLPRSMVYLLHGIFFDSHPKDNQILGPAAVFFKVRVATVGQRHKVPSASHSFCTVYNPTTVLLLFSVPLSVLLSYCSLFRSLFCSVTVLCSVLCSALLCSVLLCSALFCSAVLSAPRSVLWGGSTVTHCSP